VKVVVDGDVHRLWEKSDRKRQTQVTADTAQDDGRRKPHFFSDGALDSFSLVHSDHPAQLYYVFAQMRIEKTLV